MTISTRTQPMTVGELSRRTGVPIKNLRQYTDLGLVVTLGRSPANYRLYDSNALMCVHTIGQLRGLGLTLAEIRTLAEPGTAFGSRLAELLRRSRARLSARAADIQRTLRRIDEFETAYLSELAGGRWCPAGDPERAIGA